MFEAAGVKCSDKKLLLNHATEYHGMESTRNAGVFEGCHTDFEHSVPKKVIRFMVPSSEGSDPTRYRQPPLNASKSINKSFAL